MKQIRQLLFSAILLICPFIGIAESSLVVGGKKSLVKEYDVKSDNALSITNKYGDVKVNLWDKKSFRVEIVIKANASTEAQVQAFLDAVSIVETKNLNRISLTTKIEGKPFGKSFRYDVNKKGEDKNFVEIDYIVFMPNQNSLTVHNSFGKIDIPFFKAPLSVNSQYGSFMAKDLQNLANNIEISFGKGNIERMKSGKVESKYSNLELDFAENIDLINKFGNLTIGEINDFIADIQYSSAKIGVLKGNGKVNLSFSGGFQVNSFGDVPSKMDIDASYSSVSLPASSSQFDVTVSYGNFKYPDGTTLTLAPEKPSSLTKRYKGTVGSGTGNSITVISKFGDVKIKR